MAQMVKVDGIERFVLAAQTVSLAAAVAESLGVTPVADFTDFDRIGIPVYFELASLRGEQGFHSLLQQMNLQ